MPFTREHSARGVIYNMMLAPPIDHPQDGFGMTLADLDGDGDLDLVQNNDEATRPNLDRQANAARSGARFSAAATATSGRTR